MTKELNDSQIYDIIKQYVEIKVDRMDTQELVEHVIENLTDWYSDFTLDELKESISIHDEGLYEEFDYCEGYEYKVGKLLESTDEKACKSIRSTED